MTDLQKENLKLWRHYITRILRPTYIHGFLTSFFSPVDTEQILSLEEKSVIKSAELFLDCLLKLEEQGWYRAFLDELRGADYTGLEQAIENADFTEIAKLEEPKKLLERILPTIVSNIKPCEVIHFMPTCLRRRECEEIIQISQRKGSTAGAEKLLDCLQRSDKQSFLKEFQLALERCNCNAVTLLLSPDSVEMKTIEENSSNSMTNDVEMHYSEEAESMNTSSAPVSNTEKFQQTLTDVENLQLRDYQLELAEHVLVGDNTIICAPTGCGKTIVALYISEDHLNKAPKGVKRKVVFMATTVPVYEQQHNLFKKHFDQTSYKVCGLCADKVDSSPVQMLVERNDIIVLTPQILLNCLKDERIPSLSLFTLLIFDECHNTTKNHPYNVLMKTYMDLKLGPKTSSLPQIVGLTASLGVGDASSLNDAVNYILQICANLDAESLSTVQKNVAELNKYVFVPKKYTRQTTRRPKDPFADIISQMMAQIEAMARSNYNIDNLSHIQNRSRGTQKYEQWIVEVQKKCKVLQMDDIEEERRICRALFTYTEHLRKYNDALIINDDARTKDAIDYLEEFFNNVKEGGYDETEQKLTALFEDKKQQLSAIGADPSNENPKLTEVKSILKEEYENNLQTKTILFVRTRALADALRKWLLECQELAFLQPEMLLGRSKNTGMTLPLQKEVLISFKGDSGTKILVATSVADEGIDIAQCNLVLLYEYVGNVIKMIQTRGRGRAQNSKCILITSKKEQAEKDMLHFLQEEMMYKAIREVQQLGQADLVEKINTIQLNDKMMRELLVSIPNTEKPDVSYELLCGKCKTYACNSDDIRVIEECHHTIIDNSFQERYSTQPHKKPKSFNNFQKRQKLHCKNCKHDWGITANYKVFIDLPIIKIESFILKNVKTSELVPGTKWKNVPFSIKLFDGVEMANK
ncbi:antiviral innate immune response receptor RIG-I-like isoform X2 [Hemiscyllium ocellatum]|uniref:antiviral innate immune response receptor RIG-I-like isoform X2 n=1 Tax=Hemiscyllium ocellatum TaxID=170820 RepID=UPI0029676E79|nr:antiviral innate immune response receptor RIG-I-like isoform X2 [Hemiscyllium ocellatum]XP_060695445.1 antiviral innate immune response receptor RIG-I-like isoform X2 [Hemiscyllium ocellatum]